MDILNRRGPSPGIGWAYIVAAFVMAAAALVSAGGAGAAGPASGRYLADGEDCGNVFADAAEKVLPSVVGIYSGSGAHGTWEADGLGSGVIVGPRGLILTNNHVVARARSLRVRLSDDRVFDAVLVAADRTADVAVLSIKGGHGNLPWLPLGDSDKLKVGEWVAALGSPFGRSETMTTGIVSAKGKRNTDITAYGDFIRTDAVINPDNSGGALVNLRGELIGVNTAHGKAIPSNFAKKVMQDLVSEGTDSPKPVPTVTRGWLGISIQTVTESLAEDMELSSRKGALVTEVSKGGPGQAAGLKLGDVILRLDDTGIPDAEGLLKALADAKPGKEVDLTFMRGIKTLEITVKVGRQAQSSRAATDSKGNLEDSDWEDSGAGDPIGLQVSEPDAGLRRRYHTGPGPGVVVLDVAAGSRAEEAGLKEGDFILEAGNRPISSTRALQSAVAKARKKGKLLLRFRRGEDVLFAAVRFG